MLVSKVIVVNESKEEYRLAGLLLRRASECETNGEVEFYSAVLGYKQGYLEYGSGEFVELLQLSAKLGHPFAIAELYRLSDKCRMTTDNDSAKYEKMFEVGARRRDDYPSFSQAVKLTSRIFHREK
ncbi:hypothetical protein D9M71_544300 [compost metagenome]